MLPNRSKQVLLTAIGLWALSLGLAAMHFGLLNSILNPFLWLSSGIEFVEFLIWLATGGDLGLFLGNLGTQEAGHILYAGASLLAVAVSATAIYSHQTNLSGKKELLLFGSLIGWPLIGGSATVLALHYSTSAES